MRYMSVQRFDFEVKNESEYHTGTMHSYNSFEVGNSYTFTFGSLALPAKIVRKKQHWIGMKSSQNAILYEYELLSTDESFADYVECQGLYTLQRLATEAGVPIPENSPQTPFFLNFSGTKWELIGWIADALGKRWAYLPSGSVVYKELPQASELSFPQTCISAVLEEGWFGTGSWNGVAFEKIIDYGIPVDHKVTIKKEKARIVLEQPFSDPTDNNFYCIANVELVEQFPYDKVTSVLTPTPPLGAGFSFSSGLTSEQNKNLREWDYTVKTISTVAGDIPREIVIFMRIATPYIDTGDSLKSTLDNLWENVFGSMPFPYFTVPLNVKIKKVQTETLGDAPFLKISVTDFPDVFQTNYANKIKFLNTKRKRLTYTKEFKNTDSIPTLESNYERIQYSYSLVEDLIFATLEVIA